jgi:hypothetical protein
MTYKEWATRPDLIEQLGALLDHPTLQLALAVCTDVGLPRTKFPPTTPNLIENHALANAKHEGYFEFPKNLRALATARIAPVDEDKLTPWKYTAEIAEV